MTVDTTLPVKILVVHGVEIGDNADLHQDDDIRNLIHSRLTNAPFLYDVEMYRYEDINDEYTKKLIKIADLLKFTNLGAILAKDAIDLVSDVVVNLQNGSTAAKIRQGLKDKLMDYYNQGNGCYVLAHSLGSIYSFDVVCDFMRDGEHFKRDDTTSWPIQGLITMGSPIGLHMFRDSRTAVPDLGPGTNSFSWYNCLDRNDPIVSGDIFGTTLDDGKIAEDYLTDNGNQGWFIQDIIVDTGKTWVSAHTAYWQNSAFGDVLVNLIMS